MKTITTLLGIAAIVASCSTEPTHRDKVDKVVREYLDKEIEKNPGYAYVIDSMTINDVSPKIAILLERKELLDEVEVYTNEMRKYQKQLTDTKDLLTVIASSGAGKDDPYVSMGLNNAKEYATKIKEAEANANSLLEEIDAKTVQAETADSISVQFYEIIARGGIISPQKVQKTAVFPFYISPEYNIIKEPKEFK